MAVLSTLFDYGTDHGVFLNSLLAALGSTAVYLGYQVYRQKTRFSLANVPGPKPDSFILGNLCEIFQSQAGVPDFKYQELYGDVVRVHGIFGEHRLMISDPKALQYIVHTSGYAFPKWPERTEISRVLMGRGLLWADGDIHKRQRKVMLPGFGVPESKSFVPIFRRVATELTAQWTDILASSRDQTAVLNVASWLSRATMDSIGEAAFDYHFGALQNTDNEFMHAYFCLMSDTLGSPPTSAIFLQTFMPLWYLQLMSRFSQRRNLVHARHTARLANAVAKELVETKAEALLQGKGNRDILSLLVKANASENSDTKLTEEEIYAQMRTILLAGHETSATTLCWVLLELARHPEVQQRLRQEIRESEQAIRARGGSDFTASDLDNMSYLHAVIKESMRYHPALYQNYRQAARDDVIPLSKPIVGRNGEIMNELPVAKGTKIILSIAAYNRNKETFGEDAHEYKPERWLDNKEKKGPTLGVYGNLLTFAGGVRTCIGWRFALYEVLSLTVEIISNFELGLTPDIERLRREACLVMLPTLEGEQLKASGGYDVDAVKKPSRQQPCSADDDCNNAAGTSSRFSLPKPPLPIRHLPSTNLTASCGRARALSTQREWSSKRADGDSIFSSSESPWDHILREHERTNERPSQSYTPSVRRQTMTDSEKNIIRELLEEVFHAKQSQSPELLAKARFMYEATEPSKGKGKRRRLQQDDSDIQVVVDELKQAVQDCPTKIQLLQWTQANVFSMLDSNEASSSQPTLTKRALSTTQQLRLLQDVIPNLMRSFRQRFNDPHLALFIFRAVRNHSTQSYVYGCSTATYNELITLLWDSFRDLQGIRDALEEMLLNSVDANGNTQNTAERACREAMDDKLWLDRTEEGDEVAMTTLSSISDLLVDLMAAKENRAGMYGRRKRDMIRGVSRSDVREKGRSERDSEKLDDVFIWPRDG